MKRTWLAVGAVALGMAGLPAHAQDLTPLDHFSVRVGGYVSTWDTDFRANGTTQRGTEIDLNRDLGLDDNNTIGYIAVTWRPWEDHEFGFAYYTNDADSTRTIQRDITFQDQTYLATSTLATDVGIDAYEGTYNWWVVQHDSWALGPRLGLIWYKFDVSIALVRDVNGQAAVNSRRETVSADLPSPTIGGSWRWVPADQWRISADAGYFAADIENVDADVLFARAGVEWFPWEQAGFSLDYTLSNVDAESNADDFDGTVDFIDAGLRLGFVYRW